jgi:hypothetical protein
MRFLFVLAALLALASVEGAVPARGLAPRRFVSPATSPTYPRACRLTPLKASPADDVPPSPPAAEAVVAAAAAVEPAPAAPPKPAEPICGTCDGSGRIEGGWGTLPGLKWVSTTFGLRAYRPCPECARAGRRYQRVGQNLEEVWSGTPRRR